MPEIRDKEIDGLPLVEMRDEDEEDDDEDDDLDDDEDDLDDDEDDLVQRQLRSCP